MAMKPGLQVVGVKSTGGRTPRSRSRKTGLTPPDFLDAVAHSEFERLAALLTPTVCALDVGVLAAYATAYARMVAAEQALAGQPLTLIAQSGAQYQNPLVGVAASAARMVERFARRSACRPPRALAYCAMLCQPIRSRGFTTTAD